MFDSLLVQSGLVEEAVLARSDTGEVTESWSPLLRIECLVRVARQPADIPPGIDSSVTHVIYARPLIGAEKTLRVVVEGIAYRVVAVKDPGKRGHHSEILCRREEGPP